MKTLLAIGFLLFVPAISYSQSINQYRFHCTDSMGKVTADLKFEENVNPNLGVLKRGVREYPVHLHAIRNRANVTTGSFETILVYDTKEISSLRYFRVLLNPNAKTAQFVVTNEYSETLEKIGDLHCKIMAGPVNGVFSNNP